MTERDAQPPARADKAANATGAPSEASEASEASAAKAAKAAKAALRAERAAARADRNPGADQSAAAAMSARLRGFLTHSRSATGSPARTVAGYLPFGTEPNVQPALDALLADGVRVIVPVLCNDRDLDWAEYRDGVALVPGHRGTVHPDAPALGRDAIATADLVLVPALAVDRGGRRLGRGGGSYDRALARVSANALVLAVVYNDEVLEEVPAEPHDVRVNGVLTADGVTLFAAPRADPPADR